MSLTPPRLIVNADDCNLTSGVTRGILKAHDQGVVTSTSILVNLPLSEETLKELKKRKHLGLGLHLNVTLALPVSPPRKVPSLLTREGRFRRPSDYFVKTPSLKDLIREYEAQIRLFRKRFGKFPDHLDTHHHLHDHAIFFTALSKVARKWKLPIRRSRIFQWAESARLVKGLKTTNYLFGNLEAHFSWTREPFLELIENLWEGTSEIVSHPGFSDSPLRKISSFHDARESELKLFSDKRLRKRISSLGIELIRFSEI